MKRLNAPIAVLCCLAGAASANCPTTMADASHGIFVDFDSHVVRYDRRADGVVEELEFDTVDGTGYRYLSQFGVMVLESWEMQFGRAMAGTHEMITYDTPIPASLSPNMTFATNTVVRYGSDAPFDEPLSISVGPQQSETIGNCTLSTMRIDMMTGPAGDQYQSRFTYFPALGFAIYTGGGAVGEAPDFYQPVYIGTVPPVVATDQPDLLPPDPQPAPAGK